MRPTPIEVANSLGIRTEVQSHEVQLKEPLELEPLPPTEVKGVPVDFEQHVVSDGEKPQPPGPYQEKYQKLFVIAAGAGIKVVKGTQTDALHELLKTKWGIRSVKEIPVSLWDEVCTYIGKALAVKP